MQLYYFDAKARNAFRKKYPNAQIDGVKIYRDGVITTPFAEREDDSDKKRDILGIDKRMWVSLFDKINTREIIGIVNITKDGNPGIIDATNRQDFSDTPEYRALKEFILDQIYAFDEYKVYVRHHGMSAQTRRIQKVGDNVGTLVQNIDKIIEQNPEQAEQLNPLKELALVVGKGIDSAVKEQKDVEEERARHESMYMRIMSRQEDAINATHAVKTSMGKIHRQALFFYNRFPNEVLNEYFTLYSKQIYQEMVNLDRATDEIFNYSKLNLPFIDINIKELVEYLLGTYKERFAAEGIICETNIENNLEIDKTIATLMLSAIISDTLLFKSPTCTEDDIKAVKDLAKIADIDYESYGMEMLKAGTDLSSFSIKEILNLDAKAITLKDTKSIIAQVNTASIPDVMKMKADLEEEITKIIEENNLDLFMFLITDIINSNSQVIALGNSASIVEKAYNVKLENNTALLNGVVSRKKQVVPVMTENA